ncbi:MAG: precorrin-4 C(11)-methyltransferase [Proteobacteria bacterium]|nr:precorrin-4 C(11)-methyltransferase [Pseudomonadota bacterium]
MKVYFIGAGPGDPKLITLKGKEIIEKAPVVIYAGSLVNKEILQYAEKAKDIHNSAELNLDEMKEIFKKAKEAGHDVARIHTGDPSIYGAINEQMQVLDELGIDYEVIPGVSSFQAAAAALKQELTLPDVCQTITLSRVAGRTPVPEKEALRELVRTRPTLALFLSIAQFADIVETLKEGYSNSTPIAVVYKASWPEEKIVRGTLEDIALKVKEAGITKTALIMVGEVLSKEAGASLLYDKNFSHMYRSGE